MGTSPSRCDPAERLGAKFAKRSQPVSGGVAGGGQCSKGAGAAPRLATQRILETLASIQLREQKPPFAAGLRSASADLRGFVVVSCSVFRVTMVPARIYVSATRTASCGSSSSPSARRPIVSAPCRPARSGSGNGLGAVA